MVEAKFRRTLSQLRHPHGGKTCQALLGKRNAPCLYGEAAWPLPRQVNKIATDMHLLPILDATKNFLDPSLEKLQ